MLTRNFFTFVKYTVLTTACMKLKLPFKLKIKYLNATGDSFQGKAVFHEKEHPIKIHAENNDCLLYTSPSPRDGLLSRMPSSA